MSLGWAIIHKTDANGNTTEEGKRCMPYDYSGKFILSVIDYLEKMNKEITRVKALNRGKVGTGLRQVADWRGRSTAMTRQQH